MKRHSFSNSQHRSQVFHEKEMQMQPLKHLHLMCIKTKDVWDKAKALFYLNTPHFSIIKCILHCVNIFQCMEAIFSNHYFCKLNCKLFCTKTSFINDLLCERITTKFNQMVLLQLASF